MRPAYSTLNSAIFGKWIPVAYNQKSPNVLVVGYPSSGASLTYKVQHTFDDLSLIRYVNASQSTTTITITDNGPPENPLGHGLSVGDYVNLTGTGLAGMDGEYSVATVTDSTHYTVTSATSQTAKSTQAKVTSARVFDNDTLNGATGRGYANYTFPITAVRLNVTTYVSGIVTLEVLQGLGSP